MQKYEILIQSNEQLISCLESKYSAKFLYFWGIRIAGLQSISLA